jgi:hypothetical protein
MMLTASCSSIWYQSTDMRNPRMKSGAKTTPAVIVSAVSGSSAKLPPLRIGVASSLPIVALAGLSTMPSVVPSSLGTLRSNNSRKPGARMSREYEPRRRRPAPIS